MNVIPKRKFNIKINYSIMAGEYLINYLKRKICRNVFVSMLNLSSVCVDVTNEFTTLLMCINDIRTQNLLHKTSNKIKQHIRMHYAQYLLSETSYKNQTE